MKIRYPGPSVPPERRALPEYVSAFGLPLPVGEVLEVPDAHGQALVYTGLVEQVDEAPAAAPAPASESFKARDGAVESPEPAADAAPRTRASKGDK